MKIYITVEKLMTSDVKLQDSEIIERVKKQRKKGRQFIMGCPVENCRGFLSQAWKCGTCKVTVCSKCRLVKEEGHECNENDVATANLLKSDTKPCPTCAVPIFKIDGCDLMWCTSCHETFSWKTHQTVKVTNNHNPHFYQWQRENNGGVAPRVPGDNPCGNCDGLPWIQTLRTVSQQRNHRIPDIMLYAHRLVGHIRNIVMPHYPNRIEMQDNSDLRVSYLVKEINKEYWLKQLKMRQKKAEKDREVNQVLDMFITALADLFNSYITGETIEFFLESAETLRIYVNRELENITKIYCNKTPIISSRWSIPT